MHKESQQELLELYTPSMLMLRKVHSLFSLYKLHHHSLHYHISAVQQFNNRQLDNVPMHVAITGAIQSKVLAGRLGPRTAPATGSPQRGRMQMRGGRGRGRGTSIDTITSIYRR